MLVRRFVNNPVAANMLMILILGGGFVAAFLVPREIFPEFSVDIVTITVPYPGATPEDIERGICLKIEDYVSNLEDVKEISSSASEGVGVVTLELQTDADVRKIVDDVKSEVDKITFPKNAEDPIIKEATLKHHVIHVAIYGQAEERTLKELAEDVRDEINALPELSQVYVSGVRDSEISVEIDEQTRRRLGITLEQVARAIRESSFDLPAGRIKTRAGELSIRIVGQRYTAEEFATIPVLYKPDGTVIYLRDIAVVREAFEDVDIGGEFNGQPAALVSVFKTSDEDTIEISQAVREYVAEKQPLMPEGIYLETWSDLSRLVKDRLDILIKNGIQGLGLVFLVLWLFLGWRLSFWVAMGIPLSLLGAVLVMYLSGLSLNMVSMFALIMSLGLIVDDAIVVGESVYSRIEKGTRPRLAAVEGANAVLFPVIGAVTTTWVAFIPLLFIPGVMGRFIKVLPLAVILALGFSLLECVMILPSHLAHSLEAIGHRIARREKGDTLAERIRIRIDATIHRFINDRFASLFSLALRNRYVTVSLFVGIMIVMLGAKAAGLIPFTTFPRGESDTLQAVVILPTGTPIQRTREVTRLITSAAQRMSQQINTDSGEPLVKKAYTLLGQQSDPTGQIGGHVGEVIVELLPSERRGRVATTAEILAMWRKNTGVVPDALTLRFQGFRGGPGGKALEFRVLANNTDQAKNLATQLKDKLATFDGVMDIEDNALPGKMEIQITPRRTAFAAGINANTLANQLRDAFYGNESIEIQRGRDEIKVMVRKPQSQRESMGHIESMRIMTPEGREAPFTEVADVNLQRGYTTLRRVGGKSVVTVTADVDERIANAEQILDQLERSNYLEELASTVPGAMIDLRGQRQQAAESLGSLRVLFPMALLGIYTILAAIFRSYVQPIIIMVAIPFGLVGAVIGHWLLGFDVTILSLFGMVALAGIVVNDSLVLLDLVNQRARSGCGVIESLRAGACERFRPIILTTVTTVVGMTPLLFERSFQAQFLKPMVVSITFGLAFATMLTLLVVPCLYLIGNDLRRFWRWRWTGTWPSQEDVVVRNHEKV